MAVRLPAAEDGGPPMVPRRGRMLDRIALRDTWQVVVATRALVWVVAIVAVLRFGIEPKIALLSRSDFGSYECDSGRKMRAALDLILAHAPGLEVDGEMNGESALVPGFRQRVYPHSRLTGEANVLIMPNIDAANTAYQMIKVLGDALPVGPILIGAACPAHILTPSTTARGVVNMTAFAAVDAQQELEGSFTLGDGSHYVTLNLDPSGWFGGSGAARLDPTVEANRSQIENEVQRSFQAFQDDDHDGHRDRD